MTSTPFGWLRREELEQRETRQLADVATHSGKSAGRRIREDEDAMRTAFQRDRDRVIHSTAFRRLQHKTQVLAATDGDHHRSRMTHSLEVSQLARGACNALRLNPDLAETIALAHDLGHPPFGHAGEHALDELMRDHGGFRHNAQGVRIVDLLEDRYGHGHGLNLTLESRQSLLKGRVPDGFPLSPDLRHGREAAGAPSPIEARVVDRCDRIAYLCHDLDDGLRAGFLRPDEVAELRLWRSAAKTADGSDPHRIISEMVAVLIHDLVAANAEAVATAATGTDLRIHHGDRVAVESAELLEFLRERFYRNPAVLARMDEGSERIRTVFESLCTEPARLPPRVLARIESEGRERTVCDYVSGMTDRFLLGANLG